MLARVFNGLRNRARVVLVPCSGVSRLPALRTALVPEVQVVQRAGAIEPMTALTFSRGQSNAFQVPSMQELDFDDARSLLQLKMAVVAAAMCASVYGNTVVYSAPVKRSLEEVGDAEDDGEDDGEDDEVIDLSGDLTAALRNAEGCVDERLCEATQIGYSSGVKQVKAWLKKMKLSEHLDADGNLVVPLPEIVVKQYFGDNSYHKLKKGDTAREKKAYSTVNGYRSALKDHYASRKVSNADQLAFDEFVQPFLAGIMSAVVCRCAR